MKKTTAIWAAPLFALGMFSAATAAQRPYETVYAMSNSSRGNEVAVLSRGSGGQLTLAGRYSTAGRGSGVGTAAPGDPLGSGRALIVTENGRWLLATNAGSDTVSSFRMVGNRLALSSVVASGGRYPTSIAQRGNLIYVLNASDVTRVSPDAYLMDSAFLARPGNEDIQLDLFLDYASNVALYPKFHEYFRKQHPPLLAVWGKNDPLFIPPGAEAFKRDNPNAEVHFFDAGHFALETQLDPIAAQIRQFLARTLSTKG